MENASKALLMSASVLIGVLILSLMVFLFASFSNTAIEVEQQNNEREVTKFNSRFVTFERKEIITIYDIVSIANYAREINKEKNESEQVVVKLGTEVLTNANISDKEINDRIKNNIENKTEIKYKLIRIEYNQQTGKVKLIQFDENDN